MFLGRPVQLWAGLFALIGSTALTLIALLGIVPPEQMAAVTAAIGSVVALASGIVSFLAGQPPVVQSGDKVSVQTPAGQPNREVIVR